VSSHLLPTFVLTLRFTNSLSLVLLLGKVLNFKHHPTGIWP
jgi:hypothetical protein